MHTVYFEIEAIEVPGKLIEKSLFAVLRELNGLVMEKSQAQPWWKFGHVWLVLAGPAVVVVASFITLYLAIKSPDPVISDEFRSKSSQSAAAEAPAMQARNHAATGVPVSSKP